MMFNEFNRRLEKCRLDEDTRFLLGLMFEVQLEQQKQIELAGNLITHLADTVSRFVALHESTQEKIRVLQRGGRLEGVEVHSVRNEPED